MKRNISETNLSLCFIYFIKYVFKYYILLCDKTDYILQ